MNFNPRNSFGILKKSKLSMLFILIFFAAAPDSLFAQDEKAQKKKIDASDPTKKIITSLV